MNEHFSVKESTGYWVRQTYTAMSERLQSHFDKHGVTVAQWPVLSALHDGATNGTMNTPAELATHLGLNRSAITRLLDRLEKKALIEREVSPEDKRSVHLTLTTEGRDMVPKLAGISREINHQFLTGLSEDEVEQFNLTLKKIISNADTEN